MALSGGDLRRGEVLKAPARRPLKTRERPWARSLARRLAAAGVRPNAVSAASVGIAAAAGTLLALAPLPERGIRAAAFFVAAGLVQLRLACNMLDGLLAVEGGLGSPTGEIWNDLPDRIADPLILVGAGLALRELPWGTSLGWTCALLALLTSYVRVLGGSLGLRQSFAGPMAKQHRMFAVTLGCVGAAIESLAARPPRILWLALAVAAVGSAVTAARRVRAIAREVSG